MRSRKRQDLLNKLGAWELWEGVEGEGLYEQGAIKTMLGKSTETADPSSSGTHRLWINS